jgi:hypothetical protein
MCLYRSYLSPYTQAPASKRSQSRSSGYTGPRERRKAALKRSDESQSLCPCCHRRYSPPCLSGSVGPRSALWTRPEDVAVCPGHRIDVRVRVGTFSGPTPLASANRSIRRARSSGTRRPRGQPAHAARRLAAGRRPTLARFGVVRVKCSHATSIARGGDNGRDDAPGQSPSALEFTLEISDVTNVIPCLYH